MVESALASEVVQFKDRIYTPFVTLCQFSLRCSTRITRVARRSRGWDQGGPISDDQFQLGRRQPEWRFCRRPARDAETSTDISMTLSHEELSSRPVRTNLRPEVGLTGRSVQHLLAPTDNLTGV